jgi:phosphoglycerate kinase
MRAFDFTHNRRGLGVVLRASLNAPLEQGAVRSAYRLDAALRTIEALSQKGARTVVIGHIGRSPTESLAPVYAFLKQKTSVPLMFSDEVVGKKVCRQVEALQPGEVLLVENVRRIPGETTNDPLFAEQLASYGSVYMNDAFADSHRAHASIVGVPRHIPGFAGPEFMRELHGITPARTPVSPSIAIVGGAKFVTKEPLIRMLLDTYDAVFVGGALAHDFFVARGLSVGRSLVSHDARVGDLAQHKKLILPTDVIVEGSDGIDTKKIEDVSPTDTIVDCGPESIRALVPTLERARTILWNGPLGNFERGFQSGTESLALHIARVNATRIVGGGDTVASIHALNVAHNFTHLSGAGGAMLEFISRGTLAGIDALD